MQEIIAARDLLIFYDDFGIPHGPSSNLEVEGEEMITFSMQQVLNFRSDANKERLDLMSCIAAFKDLSCADGRDRLYAFRFLVERGGSFRVDYSESALQLAVRATIFFGGDATTFNSFATLLELRGADCSIDPGTRTACVAIPSSQLNRPRLPASYSEVTVCKASAFVSP